jgi:phospholipase C
VNHTTIDFTSQLKFIENNWGVKPLAKRDSAANDISSAFNFAAPPREAIVLSEQRHVLKPPQPTTGIVYTLYGAALAVPALVLGWSWLLPRLRWRGLRRGKL